MQEKEFLMVVWCELKILSLRVTVCHHSYPRKGIFNPYLTAIKDSCMSHVMRKLFMPYANNKGADQPAHLRSLICTFVVHCLGSIIPLVSISKISSLYLVSATAQTSLSLDWSQTPKTGFLMTWLIRCHDPKSWDRQAWANSLIMGYTVCHSACIIWKHTVQI